MGGWRSRHFRKLFKRLQEIKELAQSWTSSPRSLAIQNLSLTLPPQPRSWDPHLQLQPTLDPKYQSIPCSSFCKCPWSRFRHEISTLCLKLLDLTLSILACPGLPRLLPHQALLPSGNSHPNYQAPNIHSHSSLLDEWQEWPEPSEPVLPESRYWWSTRTFSKGNKNQTGLKARAVEKSTWVSPPVLILGVSGTFIHSSSFCKCTFRIRL